MIGGLIAFLAVAAGLAPAAEARMHAPYRGHRIVAGTAAPLDTFTTPAAAYSLRKLRSAYGGPAVRLRRGDNNVEADIPFLGFTSFTGAPIDVAAANAHCAATSCTVVTWYDQAGARNLTNPPASQLDFVFNCRGTLPCARTSGARHLVAASPVTPAGAQSLSVVGRVDGAEQQCTLLNAGKQQAVTLPSSFWQVSNGTQVAAGPAVTVSFHAMAGVVNGAASVVNIDGAEATGTVSVVTTADNVYVAYGAGGANPCSLSEAVWWDGYALTPSERSALVANQRSFWGF